MLSENSITIVRVSSMNSGICRFSKGNSSSPSLQTATRRAISPVYCCGCCYCCSFQLPQLRPENRTEPNRTVVNKLLLIRWQGPCLVHSTISILERDYVWFLRDRLPRSMKTSICYVSGSVASMMERENVLNETTVPYQLHRLPRHLVAVYFNSIGLVD